MKCGASGSSGVSACQCLINHYLMAASIGPAAPLAGHAGHSEVEASVEQRPLLACDELQEQLGSRSDHRDRKTSKQTIV